VVVEMARGLQALQTRLLEQQILAAAVAEQMRALQF
jgi:hypothetical protein